MYCRTDNSTCVGPPNDWGIQMWCLVCTFTVHDTCRGLAVVWAWAWACTDLMWGWSEVISIVNTISRMWLQTGGWGEWYVRVDHLTNSESQYTFRENAHECFVLVNRCLWSLARVRWEDGMSSEVVRRRAFGVDNRPLIEVIALHGLQCMDRFRIRLSLVYPSV